MKNRIVWISVLFAILLIGGSAYYVSTPGYLARRAMHDIKNGYFPFRTRTAIGMTGSWKLNGQFTDQYMKNAAVQRNLSWNRSTKIKLAKEHFRIPKDVTSYKLLKTEKIDFDCWEMSNLSHYGRLPLGRIQPNVPAFSAMRRDRYRHKHPRSNYSKNRLEFVMCTTIEKRYTFHTKTTTGVVDVELAFVKIPKGRWKLGAIYY
jgi:hypothetical protein